MKKIGKGLMLFLMAVVLSGICLPLQAQAAGKKPAFEQEKRTLFYSDPNGSNFTNSLRFVNLKDDAVISNVKVSDPSVLTARASSIVSAGKVISTTILNTGKTDVSCTVTQNHKQYQLKCTITVKKASPFAYVKVNGENLYKNGSNPLARYSTQKKTAKIQFKLQSGWKIKKLFYNYHKNNSMTKDKTFKNGGKIKIRSGESGYTHTSVKIDVQNKKGEVYRYLITINR